MGHAPQSLAKAASERIRSGLSPKIINIAAAVLAPTAKPSRRVGDVSVVSRARCRSCVVISSARVSQRRASDRSVCFPHATGVSSGPGRSPAQRVTRARSVRACKGSRSALPLDGIPDRNLPVREDRGVDPAAPSVTQLRAQAGQLCVHPLARARFAVDAQTTRPDPQNIPAAVLQIDSRDEEIRSSQHRIDVLAQRFRNSFPPLARHDCHLPGLVDDAKQSRTRSCVELDARERVHRSAATTLAPDSLQSASHTPPALPSNGPQRPSVHPPLDNRRSRPSSRTYLDRSVCQSRFLRVD